MESAEQQHQVQRQRYIDQINTEREEVDGKMNSSCCESVFLNENEELS